MSMWLHVRPGFWYEIVASDGVAVGTRWAGGKLVQKGTEKPAQPTGRAGRGRDESLGLRWLGRKPPWRSPLAS